MKKFRSDPKEDKFKVLKEYILRQRDRGFAMEDIKKALIKVGWNENIINSVIEESEIK